MNHLDFHPAYLSTPMVFPVAPWRRNLRSKFGLSIPTIYTRLLPMVSITCTHWFRHAKANAILSSGAEVMLVCIAMPVSGLETTRARGTFGRLPFPRSCLLVSMVSALLDLMPVGLSRWEMRSTAALSCLFDGMLARSCCRGSEITTSRRTGNGFRYAHPCSFKDSCRGGASFTNMGVGVRRSHMPTRSMLPVVVYPQIRCGFMTRWRVFANTMSSSGTLLCSFFMMLCLRTSSMVCLLRGLWYVLQALDPTVSWINFTNFSSPLALNRHSGYLLLQREPAVLGQPICGRSGPSRGSHHAEQK